MNLDLALDRLAKDADADLDLAELSLELARDEYPDLDVDAYLSEIASMAHEARRYARGNLEARVKGLCRYLFHDMGFRGNQQDYYDPSNSYLNQVLDRRTGIPISLSAITMAIGKRIGLTVTGVGLPGHFVAKATDGEREILFDPFHGGRLLTSEACENLVRQVTGAPFRVMARHLVPMPLGRVLQRMLANLKAVYLRTEDFHRAVRIIERLRQLAPHDPLERRDLGLTLVRLGEPGKAINHLSAYLEAAGPAEEAANVRRVLQQAQSAVARWN
jgi:regulator of sirC expression with transglutaminase-like and TPR domain